MKKIRLGTFRRPARPKEGPGAHEHFMSLALAQARLADERQEVPVGAVLVKQGRIVARGHNRTRKMADPTAHAEMMVIRRAIARLKNERFLNTILYVTLEPCAMCAGAIVQARIPVVVFGAADPKAGACGSVFRILPNMKLNHRPLVVKDVLEPLCGLLLKQFFSKKRKKFRG